MDRTGIARRIGRGLMVLTLAVSVGSLTSPGTAYAKHGNGAAITLGGQGTTQRRSLIIIPMRRRFTRLRLHPSILTCRRLRIMFRCRTMGRDITTADTEGRPIRAWRV